MSFIESLALLLLGTLLGSLIIPFITSQWQQQRKALDIKAELVNEVTQITAEMIEEKSMVVARRVINFRLQLVSRSWRITPAQKAVSYPGQTSGQGGASRSGRGSKCISRIQR